MTYRFTYENSDFDNLELTDPTLEIIGEPQAKIYELDPANLTLAVDIVLTKDGVRYQMRLKQVVIQNLEYNSDQLRARIITRLEDFKI